MNPLAQIYREILMTKPMTAVILINILIHIILIKKFVYFFLIIIIVVNKINERRERDKIINEIIR